LLWFSEPDHAQHAHGVGSAVALQAIHEADQQFGRLLSCLEERELSGDTNVMVVSDHGYSTISEVIAIEASVRTAGFPPGEEPGGVTVAANGGSVLFYTHGADTATADRLAAWLMSQPWCGALAAFGGTEAPAGTLPMSLIGLDGTRAPQLAMSFRWDSTSNNAGYQGRAYSSGLAPGQGQHGSMSRHETRNVLFARGPDFKQGVSLTSPTGNTDLAPTILHLLGLPGGEGMDGRVLHEALRGAPESVDWHTAVHYAERRVEGGFYRQSITVSQVGSTTYVDEGQGGVE
jgi:arylsulfatase A-like enzyme